MALVPGDNCEQHKPAPPMLICGKTLAFEYCSPSVEEASNPMVSGTNQLPCLV